MIYRFEQFIIDTEQYQLNLNDKSVPVEPLVFDLLVYLIENRNKVVGRDELLDKLWPGKVVSDSALAARLKDARKALGDSGARQEVIKTVHGRGYQFIAQIDVSDSVNPASKIEMLLSGQKLELPSKPSIAVLPLKNESDDIEEEYFSDGVTDGIINKLTRFRGLFVMGRSSSFSFKNMAADLAEVGNQLGVRYLLRGTVRKLGKRVRVSVELVDALTGQILWSERYDRELEDVFAVEDEVSHAIVSTLVSQVEDAVFHETQNRAPENLAAYEWVMRGNCFLERGTREDLLEAQRMYEFAAKVDPDCSPAYTGLSKVHIYLHWGLLSEDHHKAVSKALEFGQKAVDLDDKDSRAHYAIGHAYFSLGQHEQAEFHVEKALALNPSEYHHLCAKGYLLACTGRHDESMLCFSESLRRNPLAPNSCYCGLGISDYMASRYKEAAAVLAMLSSDLPRKFSLLAASHAQLGNKDKAREAVREYCKLMDTELVSLLKDDPTKWREHWANLYSILIPEDFEHLLQGLRKAGMPT
jgi:TolB-like protein/Tfp pilus assembly protein PilF